MITQVIFTRKSFLRQPLLGSGSFDGGGGSNAAAAILSLKASQLSPLTADDTWRSCIGESHSAHKGGYTAGVSCVVFCACLDIIDYQIMNISDSTLSICLENFFATLNGFFIQKHLAAIRKDCYFRKYFYCSIK